MKVPAGKHMLDLVAVDWFKDSKRMDHVARRHGCAAQVSNLTFCFLKKINGRWLKLGIFLQKTGLKSITQMIGLSQDRLN